MENNTEIWRIIKLVEGGDLEKSLDLVNQLIDDDITNYDALFIRGNINIFRKDYVAAVHDFTRADLLRPNNPTVLGLLADAKKMSGQYEDALQLLNKAVALAPDSPKALHQRASDLGMTGRYQLALRDLDKSLSVEPLNAAVIRDRGMTKHFLGDIEGALADLDRADRLDPLNYLTLSLRGKCKMILGDYKGALEDLTKSNQIKPNDETTLKYLGKTKVHLNDLNGAANDLKKSLEIDSSDGECKILLATVENQNRSIQMVDALRPVRTALSVLEIKYSTLKVLNKIGEGGYGEVHLAQLDSGIKVALKKLKSTMVVADLSEEAKTLMVLRYKHIVTLMGVTVDPASNSLALVMEYMKHGSLEDFVIKLKVKLNRLAIVQIALDIAKGLNYLHSQSPKIIHRDLKSANVLLYADKKRAKISDFGTAKFLRESEALPITVIGAFGIALPPEMVAEVEYDEKVDVFSFGVVLFEMTTNSRLPVLEETYRLQRIHKYVNDPQLQQLVANCCASDPNKRPTIRQCIDDLKRIKCLTDIN